MYTCMCRSEHVDESVNFDSREINQTQVARQQGQPAESLEGLAAEEIRLAQRVRLTLPR